MASRNILIKNGFLATSENISKSDVLISDGKISDIGLWEEYTLTQADITKLADGTRITKDGTGFAYGSSDLIYHYPMFANTTDTKDRKDQTNAGFTFGTTDAPTTTSTTYSSNLPIGTQFEETTDRKFFQISESDGWVQRGTAI